MARGHPGLPRVSPRVIAKADLLRTLAAVDADATARQRILSMENDFRLRISQHVGSLPLRDAPLTKFNTNPFVLLFHSSKNGYKHIREIESDILPAKAFSSMEASAGRMVEAVVLPVYSWTIVESSMHSVDSVIDGKKLSDGTLFLASLKSGPQCLNDEMSKDIADDIIHNAPVWARDAGVSAIDFTYGVLYGTQKMSNKKDWHILRNVVEKLPRESVTVEPTGRWSCQFRRDGLTVDVCVRVGIDLWTFIAGHDWAFVELCVALIRACIAPSDADATDYEFTIADLKGIISLDPVPDNFNVGVLQRSQLEWLFLVTRHFCDKLVD